MAIEFPVNDPKPESEPTPPPPVKPQPATPPTPPVRSQPTPTGPLSREEEKNWAMLAHLSVLLNLVTGFLGPVAALAIYLVYKDRSRYVAFQSMQALLMQLILWIGGGIVAGILWVIAGLLSVVLIGLCLMPLAMVITLLPLAAIVYGIIGAVETNQGKDFRYYMISKWAEDIIRNS
jgi:uncharacterized protein